MKGREGKGIIQDSETETLAGELIDNLEKWRDGEKHVVTKAYRSHDIYDIKHSKGPDIVVGYTAGYRASKQSVLGESPAGELIEDNHDAWSGDHCCDPSYVPGVFFGLNLQKFNIGIPEYISVNDTGSLFEQWMQSSI